MFFFTAKRRNELAKSEIVGTATFAGLGSDVGGLAMGFESHALNMVALLPVVHASVFFVFSAFVAFSFSLSVASCNTASSKHNRMERMHPPFLLSFQSSSIAQSFASPKCQGPARIVMSIRLDEKRSNVRSPCQRYPL